MDTAFVIGNGESRTIFPLELLKNHGTIYGCNAIYRDNPNLCHKIVSVNPEMIDELLQAKNKNKISNELKKCDLLGHGNDRLRESVGSFPLEKLVRTYNEYSVFLNTTTKSAMPRARAEALMCGTPLVTTNNFGINRYLRDGESCLFADTKGDMLKAVNKILSSNQMQQV